MVKLPTYEGNASFDTGARFLRLSRPDNSIASGLKVMVASLEDVQEFRKRDDNTLLEADILEYRQWLRDEFRNRVEQMPEGGIGFFAGFSEAAVAEGDRRLKTKFKSYHNPARAALAYEKARSDILEQAAQTEFETRLEWRKNVSKNKLADLSATIGANPDNFGAAKAEWEDFVKQTVPESEKRVRENLMKAGTHQLQRAQLEAVAAKDPRRFTEAYAGVYKGQPAQQTKSSNKFANAIVSEANAHGLDPNMMLGMAYIESRLNEKAPAPRFKDGRLMSTAEGGWQLTNEFKRVLGVSDKFDGEETSRAVAKWTANVQERIRAMGHEPTPGKTYMFYNMGEGAAKAMLQAHPDTPIETVLRRVYGYRRVSDGREYVDAIIENNPSLYRRGMTAGQVIASFERKMASAMNATKEYVTGANSEDLAKRVVTEILGHEAEHLTARDVSEVYTLALQALQQQGKEQARIEHGLNLLSGRGLLDPYDDEHKKAVNAAIEAGGDFANLAVATEDRHLAARDIVRKAGFIPDQIAHQWRAAIVAKGAVTPQKIQAYTMLGDIAEKDAGALDATKTLSGEVKSRIKEFNAYTGELHMTPKEAIERIEFDRSPEGQTAKKAMADLFQGKESELKELSWQTIEDAFDQPWTWSAPEAVTDRQKEVAVETLQAGYRHYRMKGHSPEMAKALALNDMKRNWGVTNIYGGQVFMAFPPEKIFRPVDESYDWILKQAREHLAGHFREIGYDFAKDPRLIARVGRLGAINKNITSPEKLIEKFEIRLVPTAETAENRRNGRPVGYELRYRDLDGRVMSAGFFVPDQRRAEAEAEETFIEENSKPKNRGLFGGGTETFKRDPSGAIDPWSGQRRRPGANTPLP